MQTSALILKHGCVFYAWLWIPVLKQPLLSKVWTAVNRWAGGGRQ